MKITTYKTISLTLLLLGLVATPYLLQSQSGGKEGSESASGAGSSKNAFLGTWDLKVTFSDGSQASSTLSAMPGRSASEGTVIHSAELSLALPNPTLPEQGVWEYRGGGEFIASYRGFASNEKFEPFGKIGFRHRLTVSRDQETFAGSAVFEVIDAAGQIVFSDHVQTRGVRQHAQAP